MSYTKILSDIIYKALSLSKVFSQKDYELGFGVEHLDFDSNLFFLLLPAIQGSFLKKSGEKVKFIMTPEPERSQIVLTPVDKSIIIHREYMFITLWGLAFLSLFWRVFLGSLIFATSWEKFCF